jgi:hypothetical protein
MKLTDKLKKKIENATSEKEVKDILENIKGGVEAAGLILDDEELDKVAGGLAQPKPRDNPLRDQQ